jgi:hypothetical protein
LVAHRKPEASLIHHVRLEPEPNFGRLSIGKEPPFLLPWQRYARIHRLVPMQSLFPQVLQLSEHAKVRVWLAQHFGVDVFDEHDWLERYSAV